MVASTAVQLPISVFIDQDTLTQDILDFTKAEVLKKLEPEWLDMDDMMRITKFKRDWILENIVEDPRVKKNGWAKQMGEAHNAPWRFENEPIRKFLKQYFKEL
ncbi:DUF771 domain-containing protein [Listeria booriae]|uniref:DUF771 domain-containing protein n=1 Tax=Listeria booriae TaxID=1552123 RepID=A0A842AIN8_9LIST|nr:DUF771 domain-containing protein [Listeria booriae]MBC1616392.1 DUF771 domain-containing protein [Listeria booriae]